MAGLQYGVRNSLEGHILGIGYDSTAFHERKSGMVLKLYDCSPLTLATVAAYHEATNAVAASLAQNPLLYPAGDGQVIVLANKTIEVGEYIRKKRIEPYALTPFVPGETLSTIERQPEHALIAKRFSKNWFLHVKNAIRERVPLSNFDLVSLNIKVHHNPHTHETTCIITDLAAQIKGVRLINRN